MKASIKAASMLIVLCLCYTGVFAQVQRQSISVHEGVAIPVKNGFADKAGFVNPSVEWRYSLLPAWAVGLSLGYSYSTEKGEGDVRVADDLISGYREKSLSSMPFLAKFHYFPLGGGSSLFSPFIGVGAGIQYAKFYITGDAVNSAKTSNWAKAFSVEVGTNIQPLKVETIYFDIRCLWYYGGNSWPFLEAEPMQTVGVTLGVGFKF